MNIPDSVFSAFAAALVVVPATPARAQFSAIRQEVDFSAPDTGEIVVVQALPGFGALVQYSKIRFVARMPIPRPEEDFPRRQAEEAWFGLVRPGLRVKLWWPGREPRALPDGSAEAYLEFAEGPAAGRHVTPWMLMAAEGLVAADTEHHPTQYRQLMTAAVYGAVREGRGVWQQDRLQWNLWIVRQCGFTYRPAGEAPAQAQAKPRELIPNEKVVLQGPKTDVEKAAELGIHWDPATMTATRIRPRGGQ